MVPEAPLSAHLLVGGLLLLTAVVLLFHCTSLARRRKQRQVQHSLPGTGSDVTPDRKRKYGGWRRGGGGGRDGGGGVTSLPVIAIIVTPPSPLPSPRAGHDSIGSSGDLLHGADTPPSAGDDVSEDEPPLCPPTPPKERRLVAASATSLGGIRDVQLMTEEEMTSLHDSDDDTRGDEDDFVMTRPRLSSMPPGVNREDFHIVTVATAGLTAVAAEAEEGQRQQGDGLCRT